MQITEITSYSKEQLNEQARNQKLSDNLKKQLKEYFLDLRLQSLLLEELDIKQVSGGDWVVWDTDTDSSAGGTRFASAGEAEEARDGMRSARASRSTDNNRPDDDESRSSRRTGKNAKFAKAHFRSALKNGPLSFRTAFRRTWLFSLAGALGLTVEWGTGDNQEGGTGFGDETLLRWHRGAEAGELVHFSNTKAGATSYEDLSREETTAHAILNADRYKRMVELAYGSICVLYFWTIATAVIGPVYSMSPIKVGTPIRLIRNPGATLRLGADNVGKLIKWARRYRNIFTAASASAGALFGAGVGGIFTAAVSFILGSAAIWVVQLVLERTGAGGVALEWIVKKLLEIDLAGGTEIFGWEVNPANMVAGAGAQADRVVNAVAGVDSTADEDAIIDIKRNLLTNPQATQVDTAAVSSLLEPEGSTNGSNGSTAGPAASVTPPAPPVTGNGNSAFINDLTSD
jgi:hypothetical protein